MAMATPLLQGPDAMDAMLWGQLQSYIDLTSVFVKLPLEHFFRLRQVCKEWNRLASNPKFLQHTFASPIPKPYFVVDSHRTGHRLLAYDCGAWSWTRLPRVKCDAAGLLFCEDSDRNRVFDVHTRVFHALPDASEARAPPLPVEEEEDYEEPLVGMVVDTSVRPYSFHVILGDEVIGTRIYDSKSGLWTQKTSTHEDSAIGHGTVPRPTCACCDGVVYIRVWRACGFGAFDLHSYDLQRDEWDCEPLTGFPEAEWVFCDIGVWQDRLFMIGMKFDAQACGVTVWERRKRHAVYYYSMDDDWGVFDCMPADVCSWLLAGKEAALHVGWAPQMVDVKSRFCGEFVLVYNSVEAEDVTYRAVLYNLDLMTWEKVELPI